MSAPRAFVIAALVAAAVPGAARAADAMPLSATAKQPVPAEARGPVSSALGVYEATYHARTAQPGVATLSNRRQKLSARLTRDDALVSARGGSVSLALQAIGRGRALTPVARTAPRSSANRVTYAHRGVSTWLANGPFGIEQGFTVLRRPAGDGPLTLALGGTGSLRPRAADGAISYQDGAGRTVLHYAGLTAVDARGRTIPAHLAVARGRVVLRVDDAGARYPLSIDPLLSDQATLTGSDSTSTDTFGYAVAANADTVVVGAPNTSGGGKAYVFTRPPGGWAGTLHEQAILDYAGIHESRPGDPAGQLGWSVAISATGKTIVSSAPNADNYAGVAMLYTRPPGGWTTGQRPVPLYNAGKASFSLHGGAVAVAPDDSFVAMTQARDNPAGTGSIVIFDGTLALNSGSTDPNDFVLVNTVFTGLGTQQHLGETLTIVGHTIFAGDTTAEGRGNVYGFTKPADGWRTYKDTNVPGHGSKGVDVVLSVGATGSGDRFGWGLAGSGNTLVVGAPFSGAGNQGAAYVYTEPPGGWSGTPEPRATLVASDGAANDLLGFTVGVSGSTVAAAAPYADVGANADQGAVYLYDQPESGWSGTLSESSKALLSGGAAGDELGGNLPNTTHLAFGGPTVFAVTLGGTGAVHTFLTRRAVAVTRAGAGAGSVTGGPIDCPAMSCAGEARVGDDVTLTATPASGSEDRKSVV